jgi:hypothetical protein
MNIAELYVQALRARLLGYLVMARVTIKAVLEYGLDKLDALCSLDYGPAENERQIKEAAESLFTLILRRIMEDPHSGPLVAEKVILRVAKYQYFHDLEMGRTLNGCISTAKVKYDAMVRCAPCDKSFAEIYMSESKRVFTPFYDHVEGLIKQDWTPLKDAFKDDEEDGEAAVAIIASTVEGLIDSLK